jgi:hypothetical protein
MPHRRTGSTRITAGILAGATAAVSTGTNDAPYARYGYPYIGVGERLRLALALQNLSNEGLRHPELTGDGRGLQASSEGRSDGARLTSRDGGSGGRRGVATPLRGPGTRGWFGRPLALNVAPVGGSQRPARDFLSDGDPQTLQIFVGEQTERRCETVREKDWAAGHERRFSSPLGQREEVGLRLCIASGHSAKVSQQEAACHMRRKPLINPAGRFRISASSSATF